ncbi:MAG: 4Fe-4S dicluster domain-containing protein [Planctomycetaceae bacterium]|jgi:heterodisulfide reductase subunit C|nr:4Fe-4S dicluster domain-containing protein [Planctomycetaceae bacterium]
MVLLFGLIKPMSQQIQLQQKAKELLTDKKVDLVIGYGRIETGHIGTVFITNAEHSDQLLWNDQCTNNLVVYLKRKEVKTLGRPAIVVKGCDAGAIAVLETEHQLDRENIIVIGMECAGVRAGNTLQEKCKTCDLHQPPHCDFVIEHPEKSTIVSDSSNRYSRLEKIMAMNLEQRLDYWKSEFSRCIKCYACRQNCPMCYCDVCVADKNRPIRIDTSATLKGNFAWNILRAFHLAGRCVGCSACSMACPAGIDLDLLNLSLAKAAEEHFNYRAGAERNIEPLVGTFSPEDQENFIR